MYKVLFRVRVRWCALMLLAAVLPAWLPAMLWSAVNAGNLSPAQSAQLLQQASEDDLESFAEFLALASLSYPELAGSISAWQADPQGDPPAEPQT